MIYYPENDEVKARFFQALDAVIVRGDLRGRRTFAVRYELNTRNFYTLSINPAWKVEPAYLTYLVRDFGVRAHWLLLGVGPMFTPGYVPSSPAPERKRRHSSTRTPDVPVPSEG